MAGVCSGPGPCDTSPLGTPGGKQNWLDKTGGLDPYLRAVAHAFRRKGLSESEAIQRAWGVLRNWAEGKGNVTAETRARAAKAVANMERKRAQAHALTAASAPTIDLAATPTTATEADIDHYVRHLASSDRRSVFARVNHPLDMAAAVNAHHYRHGWIRIDAAAPTAVERATRVVVTDGHTLLHGQGMVAAAHKVVERIKATGHGARVRRINVAGKPHLHVARTTR